MTAITGNTFPVRVAVALKGFGYWDTTNYPYGGKFARLADDTVVTVTGNKALMKGGHEYPILFADGRKGWITARAIEVTA